MNTRLKADPSGTATRARARMVERVRELGIRDERVLAALLAVPRHHFVAEALASRAYEDTALPLGFQQTISQPVVVARMSEILMQDRADLGKTLEVGTGCGYQAAVLSHLAPEVYSVERIRKLLDLAKENLRLLRLPNVRLKCADGNLGLSEVAPFDSIIVAAASLGVPEALKAQLAPNGRLLIPVGEDAQRLLLIQRQGMFFKENWYETVRFVPMLAGIE